MQSVLNIPTKPQDLPEQICRPPAARLMLTDSECDEIVCRALKRARIVVRGCNLPVWFWLTVLEKLSGRKPRWRQTRRGFLFWWGAPR
jgi:hypothetical protein